MSKGRSEEEKGNEVRGRSEAKVSQPCSHSSRDLKKYHGEETVWIEFQLIPLRNFSLGKFPLWNFPTKLGLLVLLP